MQQTPTYKTQTNPHTIHKNQSSSHQEIERKFFIPRLPDQFKPEHYQAFYLWQGYFVLAGKASRTRRSALSPTAKKADFFLTQKSGSGLVRQEKETRISQRDFEQYQQLTGDHFLEKVRYHIPYTDNTDKTTDFTDKHNNKHNNKNNNKDAYIIELDVYSGRHEGFMVAEVEFDSVEAANNFVAPEWFGKELTSIKEASNGRIAKHSLEDVYNSIFTPEERVKHNLAAFYNHQAQTYANTRQKFWSEEEHLLAFLRSLPSGTIRLLEIGCGSGRFLSILNQISHLQIIYTGVDLSQEILVHAQNVADTLPENISCNFVCDDITHRIKTTEQESFDLVVGIASFHHLPSVRDRLFVLKHIYKALNYDGHLLLTNRSLSSWIVKTYWKAMGKSILHYLLSRGKTSRRDLLVPRKSKDQIFYRYYHFFGLKELRNLLRHTSFVVLTCCYLDKQGNEIDGVRFSKNSLLIAKKSVLQS